jgi:putative ATPase
MDDLFSASDTPLDNQPLAERARPQELLHFQGQAKVFGEGRLLTDLFKTDHLPSLILWGPPGSGKTSFANLVSKKTKAVFVNRSAIDTGAKDLKTEGEEGKQRLLRFSERTILFVDEIHRLNRAQQDVLLPYIEKGFLSLIGATTENPSFELNSALLSRCQVIVFDALERDALSKILDRGLKLLSANLKWSELSNIDLREIISHKAGGDGRRALNLLENIYSYYSRDPKKLSEKEVNEAIQYIPMRYDKSREMHYDTISAFIKSIRGSDPNAALYYLVKMLKGGEDPLFIARRLVILASEDVGNADPRALQVAISVKDAVDFVGLPEGAISLAQGVTYLATAPKSNRSYMGLRKAQALVDTRPNLEVPLSIRNAPTSLMKEIGYGKDYQYAHNADSGVTNQKFLPPEIENEKFYIPTSRGYEKNISALMDWVESQKGTV